MEDRLFTGHDIDAVQKAIPFAAPTSYIPFNDNVSVFLAAAAVAAIANTELNLPPLLGLNWNTDVVAVNVKASLLSTLTTTGANVWGPHVGNNTFAALTLRSMVANVTNVTSAVIPVSPLGSIWYNLSLGGGETYTYRLVVSGLFISNAKRY